MEQKLYKKFFENSPTAFSYQEALTDGQGAVSDCRVLRVNDSFVNLMGLSAPDIAGKSFKEVFPEDFIDAVEWDKLLREVLFEKKSARVDLDYKNEQWIRIRIFALDGLYFGCIFKDVTPEYSADKERIGLFDTNIDMLCVLDHKGHFVKINKEFTNALGYDIKELAGRRFIDFIHQDDMASTIAAMKDLERQKKIFSFINKFRCKDGLYKYLEWRSESLGALVCSSARDVTQQHKDEEALKTIANTDGLTGLFNRNYFYKKIINEITLADEYSERLSMILLDLDKFKNVNDTWGHPVGDEVLQLTSKIVAAYIRPADVLARLGGEEFIILLLNTGLEAAMAVAERIRKALDQDNHTLAGRFTASFGVAERLKNESFNNWYKRTDDAMYLAKERGRNCVVGASGSKSTAIATIYFEWKSEWNSGEPEIDKQHRELVAIGNDLLSMVLANPGFESIVRQLELLLEHVVAHFDSEEKILTEARYAAVEEHKKLHQALLDKAALLKESYYQERVKPSAFFSFFVDDIVVGHMIEEDVKFYELFK